VLSLLSSRTAAAAKSVLKTDPKKFGVFCSEMADITRDSKKKASDTPNQMMLHNIARQDRPDDEDAKPSPADRSGVASMQERENWKRKERRRPC
jgi:hypothetical protein